jgi:SecD/SecF fusion protein
MHNKQTGRVIFILFVLLAAMFAICPQPQKLFSSLPFAQKVNLKPGIDMVGGTSLLYQIKEPEGGFHSMSGHTLAEEVMGALKKRVDPDGVKNLIWRPQGDTRLEIQIPASPKNEEATKARDQYVLAQRQLDGLNISDAEVINAVENLKGADRTAKLHALAGSLPARQVIFDKLVTTYDAMQLAHAAQNADAEAAASVEYDKLKSDIDATNLQTQKLEAVLTSPPDLRAKGLDEIKKESANYPDRLAAIDNFTKAFDSYSSLKGAIDDAAQLKRELQGSGVLGFHILADDASQVEYARMRRQLHDDGPRPKAGDTLQWFEVERPDFNRGRSEEWNGKQYILCWITPDKSMVNGPGIQQWAMESASRTMDEQQMPAVAFRFDSVGGKDFHDLSANNLHRSLVTILDNKVLSVATLNSIIGAEGVLTNDNGTGYSDEELAYLISTLNAGSLPAQLENEPISEHTVGPQLGEDNLRRGLYACGFGLVIVGIFLISYYYLAGVVATVAVLMNVVLILGVLAAFGATFTLPGIAGIVLTIGAAVDANVLIFERLREEQHLGLGLRMAMRNAYDHALSAILDSNATTVITSVILMWLGSEEVKGFGTTLLIGLLSSLFTSLFVTRTIFNIMIDTFHVKNLSSFPLTFPKWDKFLKPDIDWMRLAPIFWVLSSLFIVAGAVAFIATAKAHELADVDFTSGTQVQFDLKQPMPLEDVRKVFDQSTDDAIKGYSLTSAGNDNKSYEIITPDVDAKAVRSAVMSVMGDRITTDQPSKFDQVGAPIEAALNNAVLPIATLPLKVNGYTVAGAEDYLGGAAIVLNNLNPPLRLDQIRDRLDRQRVQEQAANSGSDTAPVFHDFTVVSPDGPGVATKIAIVLTADPAMAYDKDQAKWLSDVANPMWHLVNDAVNRQGTLQKVNNFDAQVAGDTQDAALFALILSSVVIMAYIWFRFGNLKYGTATVLAMIHDVALVVGAVGLSHYVVKLPWLAQLLLIEPFRVNLTIVAAVLTVMSYSMIDTIVVFDRIRENRGKFGYLSKKIVNDSINQTLSRTLLTAGTTIVTVAGMYVVGGPGIHGFTFVLLVGILVGTYSSIAIAAPFLLIGVEVKKESNRKGPSGNLVPKQVLA